MSRIGPQSTQPLPQVPSGDAILPRGVESLPIAPRPMRSLRVIARQPPVLRWLRARLSNEASIDDVFAAEIARPDGQDTADRAFHLADFLLRNFQDLQEAPTARPGLDVLADMARMYEHLLILQDQQEGR